MQGVGEKEYITAQGESLVNGLKFGTPHAVNFNRERGLPLTVQDICFSTTAAHLRKFDSWENVKQTLRLVAFSAQIEDTEGFSLPRALNLPELFKEFSYVCHAFGINAVSN